MKHLFFLLTLPFVFSACITEDVLENTPEGNLESLWQILDQHYCFFDYKYEEYGLDWNEVHSRYKTRVKSTSKSEDLFDVCYEMIRELRDGHVNITAAHDVARYWDWFENYPENFSDSIQRNYLGKNYRISSGIKYTILDDNIGYVYCSSFDSSFGDGNLSEIFRYMAICDGIIIDVRNNSGGMLTSALDLAGCLTNEKIVGGYIVHKTGAGHSDFSSPATIYVEPATGVRWQKNVAILTNRRSYSATNSFVMFAKACPNVTTVGDKTGGGAGLPFTSELPNGWSIRLSASPMYDKNMEQTEMGIDPDVKVDISSEDYNKGIDTIIEAARKLLNEKTRSSLEISK